MTKEGIIHLIYPIFINENENTTSEIDNSYFENTVIHKISEKHKIDLYERQLITLLFNNEIRYVSVEEHILEYMQ